MASRNTISTDTNYSCFCKPFRIAEAFQRPMPMVWYRRLTLGDGTKLVDDVELTQDIYCAWQSCQVGLPISVFIEGGYISNPRGCRSHFRASTTRSRNRDLWHIATTTGQIIPASNNMEIARFVHFDKFIRARSKSASFRFAR